MSKEKVIGFHKIDEPNGFLSNWYPAPFDIGVEHFSCVEQYMMHKKAELFQDKESMSEILRAKDPDGKFY